MDIRRTTLVNITLLLTVLLAACATENPDPSPTKSAALVNTQWVLRSLSGAPLIEGTRITLNFEEASIDGSAGCNTYGGSYTVSEDSLRLSGMYWTEMGCLEPVGVMDQETVYLQALRAAARYRVDGDRLEVYDEAGAEVLAFVAATTVSELPTKSITPEPQESDLTAKIDVPTALDSGGIMMADFTLTNSSSDGFYVLKWFTPLEGMAGDIFRVERDGAELPYRGKLVKRGAPVSEDYVWLAAGESVSAEVDLAEGYDFSQAGQYTIQFGSPQISHVAKTETDKAVSFEELGMIQIPSNTANVVIEGTSGSQNGQPTAPSPASPVPATEPAAGFKQYQDAVAGVSVNIPESWVVTGIVPGQWAILQSYPEDKYVGGERRAPGDTKCDLNIRPPGTSAADLIQQWKSNPDTAIIAEGDVLLQSGQLGKRIELENRGRSLSLISDVNGRAVALTCWGEFEPFHEISVTLSGTEAVPGAPPAPDQPGAGSEPYQDQETGVSVLVPENWVVTGIVPGHTATLQSADTQCELFIRPAETSMAQLVQEMRNNTAITILSDVELTLASGEPGIKMEQESMVGRSLLLVTEVNERAVVLACYGEFAPFDEIAITLGAYE